MTQSDPRTTSTKGSSRSALIIVGVLALLGLAYAIARVDILRARLVTLQMNLQAQQNSHQTLQERFDALHAAAQNSNTQLAQLQASLRSLNDNFGELHDRAEHAQRETARSEALYLLRLAQDQLHLAHDLSGAIDTLTAAAALLGTVDDAKLVAVHRQVLTYLEQLRALPRSESAALQQQLSAAEQRINDLPLAGILLHQAPPSQEALPQAGLQRAWALLQRGLNSLFSLRKTGGETLALLSANDQLLRRRHLQLLLMNARLAVHSHDQTAYVAALRDAGSWLEQTFDTTTPEVARLQAQLKQLAQQDIAPVTPDLQPSIQGLQSIVSSTSVATP